jgi:ATP-dependent Clp protease adaptor protein ClpS
VILYQERDSNISLFFDKYTALKHGQEIMIADEQTLTSSLNEIDLGLDSPKRFYVLMHNDDTTPFEFVIEVLMQLFGHTMETSSDLAGKIHQEGNAIVGMYYMEIAEQKVEETTRAARNNGFTLSTSIEPAE